MRKADTFHPLNIILRQTAPKRCLWILMLAAMLAASTGQAQSDSTWWHKPSINLSGFVDVYYVYDFDRPQANARQAFLYNHNRHNSVHANLALLKLEVNHNKYRARVALQSGTFVRDNYSQEPTDLRNLFEANIGVSLSKDNNLWLTAGIMPSHIGFESAISIDNPTLTRSLLAENSPYFQAGAKLSYTPVEDIEIAFLLLNGWQRIERLPGNSLPSFGTQFNFSPGDDFELNWSTFIGTDDRDISRRYRFFNNLYTKFKSTEDVRFTAGFDFGLEQQTQGSSEFHLWFSPVLILEHRLSQAWKYALRAEYYSDPNRVIIPSQRVDGFKTFGLSANLDRSLGPNLMWRSEARWMNTDNRTFNNVFGPTGSNFILATSLALRIP